MKCQVFNTIQVNGDFIIKKACNEYGNTIISHEIQFYKNVSSNIFPGVIEMGINYLKMEYLKEYKPLKDFIFTDNIKNKLFKTVDVLHDYKDSMILSESEFKKQLYNETILKIKSRFSKITCTLPKVTHVNGVSIMSLDTILLKLEEFISMYTRKVWDFHVIHGDLNFGNIMYNGDDIKFIDPRGYFGTFDIFGPKEYDFAKIYFSLSGYDILYHASTLSCEIQDESMMIDFPSVSSNDDLVHILCISIWLAAPLYFDKTDKLIICYYYSIYLATLRFRNI